MIMNITRILKSFNHRIWRQFPALAIALFASIISCTSWADIVTTYTYDTCIKGAGRLCNVSDPSGTTAFTYDEMGRVFESAKTVDGTTYTTTTTYDDAGRVATISYPQNNGTVSYDYDGPALKRVKEGTTTFVEYADFNEMGQATKASYNNSRVVTTYSYAANGVTCPRSHNYRLCSLTTQQDSTPLQELSYSYDDIGNVVDIFDTNSGDQSFEYDDLDRLTQASGPYTTQVYDYNEIGNMLSNTRVGSYDYNSSLPHAVTSAGGNSYTYDANGNMTSVSGNVSRIITYDGENRPVQIQANGQTTTLIYDGDGGRVKKIVGSATTLYIGKHYECASSGACKRYVFAGGQRIAEVLVANPSDVSYYHPDHLGSSSVISFNNYPSDYQRLTYYPYGETYTNSNSHPTSQQVDYKFTGQMLDDSTGLYFYNARYYDPVLARFISPDTFIPAAGNPQAFNRYSYVLNNPLVYTDPSGNFAIIPLIAAIIVGATVGATINAVIADARGASAEEVRRAAIAGAITGAIMGPVVVYAPYAGPALGYASSTTTATMLEIGLNAAGGATAGAVNASVSGGNIGQGALIGGVSAAATSMIKIGYRMATAKPIADIASDAQGVKMPGATRTSWEYDVPPDQEIPKQRIGITNQNYNVQNNFNNSYQFTANFHTNGAGWEGLEFTPSLDYVQVGNNFDRTPFGTAQGIVEKSMIVNGTFNVTATLVRPPIPLDGSVYIRVDLPFNGFMQPFEFPIISDQGFILKPGTSAY